MSSDADSSPTATNCTISGNSALAGRGGLRCSGASRPTLRSCIVWGNGDEPVCGDLSDCLTDRDPLFVRKGIYDFTRFVTVEIGGAEDALPDFIVEPPDFHLRPGSPAIDAGTSDGAPTTDLDGHGRPCGKGVDIGAYEFGDCAAPTEHFRRADANADGTFDISDPVATLGYLFLGTEELPCLDAADADDSGLLDLTDAIYSLSFLFLGGPAPLPPFPECWIDPTTDDFDCASYPGCS